MLTIILSVLLAFFAVAAFLGWWEYVKANRQYHQARGAAQELARVLGDARRHLERMTPLGRNRSPAQFPNPKRRSRDGIRHEGQYPSAAIPVHRSL